MKYGKNSKFNQSTSIDQPTVFSKLSIQNLETAFSPRRTSDFKQSKNVLKENRDFNAWNIDSLSQSSISNIENYSPNDSECVTSNIKNIHTMRPKTNLNNYETCNKQFPDLVLTDPDDTKENIHIGVNYIAKQKGALSDKRFSNNDESDRRNVESIFKTNKTTKNRYFFIIVVMRMILAPSKDLRISSLVLWSIIALRNN